VAGCVCRQSFCKHAVAGKTEMRHRSQVVTLP
jgi:hypothetical protein